MNREGRTGRETGQAREMESFSLSLARSTLCTNMINKKLIIVVCAVCFHPPPFGKFPYSMPLRENFTKWKWLLIYLFFPSSLWVCVCVSWCGWHLESPLSSFKGLWSLGEWVAWRRVQVAGRINPELGEKFRLFSVHQRTRLFTHSHTFNSFSL